MARRSTASNKAASDDALLAEAMRIFDLFHAAYRQGRSEPGMA